MEKSIMFQGTASNVGKSLMAAALLRILYQEGYQAAPFKAWNMALNSYVTKNGGEVGRAQALQAEACNVDIEVDMQPFLVKPKGDGVAQVIKRGKPLGDFQGEYKDEDYVKNALNTIENSIDYLYQKYDILVMEGAGSPAEVNIQDRDLANMKVAALKNTPVILVADIDKGGVFASLVGTLELLGENRKLVKGIIINKFRGKKSSLKTGLDFLEKKTGVPVLGVMPYLDQISLPEEDSVTVREFIKKEAAVKIGIINLPHLSNFTDFDILGMESAVQLEYIDHKNRNLKDYDVIIIPGTKNTTEDLRYLNKQGLDQKIIQAAQEGKEVVGICGGYQMLGNKLIDPDLTEGKEAVLEGLSLLDLTTTFSAGKDTYQIKAKLKNETNNFINRLEGKVEGYEIHMGQTTLGPDASPLFEIMQRSNQDCQINDGAVSQKLHVWGTYIHGIFDNDNFRSAFIKRILKEKESSFDYDHIDFKETRKRALDELADQFREHIDIKRLYKIMNLSQGHN